MIRFNPQIQIKGVKKIANKIEHRLSRFKRERENIFADPLKRTIFIIKKRLAYDAKAKVEHNFTGSLSANTKYDFHTQSISTYVVRFGFFSPYGMAFEIGAKPRFVPLSILAAWSNHRFGTPQPSLAIQRSIMKKGTKGYGIIQRTWKGNQKNYINIVHKRFWRVWSR